MKMNIDEMIDDLCGCFQKEKDRKVLADMMKPVKFEIKEVKEVKKGFGIVVVAYADMENKIVRVMAGDATRLRGSEEMKFYKNMPMEECARAWLINVVSTEPIALRKLEEVLQEDMTPCLLSANIDGEVFCIVGPAMFDEEQDQKAIH